MKMNNRNARFAPRKLALLVAAALAVEPLAAHAAVESLLAAPISFERNQGQFASDILFLTRGVSGEIAIRDGEVSIAPTGKPSMRLALAGANRSPRVEAHEPNATLSNYYYRGENADRSVTGVAHFGRVVVKEVYPRVDLALHGTQGALEYDFLVAPGADPRTIRIDLSSAEEVWLDAEGNLRMRMAGGGELTQHAPVAYQMADGKRQLVAARFELHSTAQGKQAGFATGHYDATRELVIDPILSYSTYLGAAPQYGGFMKADAEGNLHIVSASKDTNATRITVTKLNPVTRQPVYVTNLQGLSGVRVQGMALGNPGDGIRTYVAGGTTAPAGFCAPCGSPGGEDAFVFAVDATGAVISGRTLGGAGADSASGIATDSSGNVYVTGTTAGLSFPSTGLNGGYHGGTEAFVTKLSPDLGGILYSTYLGGSGADTANALAVDAAGNVYVAGRSGSIGFPAGVDHHDNFLLKLDPDGNTLHSARVVGASGADILAVEVNDAGQPVTAGVMYGETESAFYARFSATSSALVSGGSVGGSTGDERAIGLAVAGNSVYLSGVTTSQADFQNTAAKSMGPGGAGDAFIARFGPSGLEMAVSIGGTGNDSGRAVAVAPSGEVYFSGNSRSANFPLYDPVNSSFTENQVFVGRVASEVSFTAPSLELWENDTALPMRVSRTGSLAAEATVQMTGVNGTGIAGTHYGTAGVPTPPTSTLTFAPGVGMLNFTVGTAGSVHVINDAVVNGPKAFNMALSNPGGGLALGLHPAHKITIFGDENSIAFEFPEMTVPEGNTTNTVMIPVVRQGIPSTGVVVSYNTLNGTALAGTHYTAASGVLTWGAGDYFTKYIPVPILGNATPNVMRNFKIQLSDASGVPIGVPTQATINIADDDDTVAMAAPTMAVTEGTPSITVKVRRTGSGGAPVSVNWTTVNATATAGADFGTAGINVPMEGTFTWAVGDVAEKSIVIPLINDSIPEPVKTFSVALSGLTGAKAGGATTTITLTDDERGFTFTEAVRTVGEATPTVTFTVQRVGATTGVAALTWTTVNGTATSGQDFGLVGNTAPRTGTLSWATGDAGNKTFTIPIINDTIGGEGSETFTVVLTPTTVGYVTGANGTATVTITDNDILPQSSVQLTEPKVIVLENGTSAVLTVTRQDLGGGFGLQSSVAYATQPGTALATSDYTTRSGTLTWAAGDSASKLITVPIVNNAVAESSERFRVVLSNPSQGTALGTVKETTVVIEDEDEVFPLDGHIPNGFNTPPGVTRGWYVANDAGAFEGVYTLKSEEIEDGQSAGMDMAGTFAAGNVSFRVKVSSEAKFDVLRFYIDGVVQPVSWSGTSVAGWQLSPTYPLTAGAHTLRWVYSKDASASAGQDRAFIDGLVTPAFTPAP